MNVGRTIFAQLMDFVSPYEFHVCVDRYGGEYKVKTFSCWDQFLCLAFAQLTFRESLRDIQACLRVAQPKLYHMGFRSVVARNTLAHANEVRDWRIYAAFAQGLIATGRSLYTTEPLGRRVGRDGVRLRRDDDRSLPRPIPLGHVPQTQGDLISREPKAGRGLVVCGVHSSSFDLVMRRAAYKKARILALSLPETNQAVDWQHDIRRQVGLEILPATIANIRQLVHRLQEGEMVLTGVDHPMPDLKYHPVFFGRPAQLTTHHIYLAQKARVPIVLLAAILQADGRYHIVSSDYIEMETGDNRSDEMVANAERVLQAAEALIRLSPSQWTVFQPLWPQVLKEVP